MARLRKLPEQSPPPPSPEAQSGVALALNGLRRLVRALRLATERSRQGARLTAAQLFVLERLREAPATSLAELSERTFTDPSSVSTVVSRLVRRGLVRRERSRADGRRVTLSLAPSGHVRLERAPAPVQSRLAAALAELPPAELELLGRVLAQLGDQLGEDARIPSLFFEPEKATRRPAARKQGARRG